MKKWITLFSLVTMMSIGGTAFAAGSDVAQCAVMSKGKCVTMCAKGMDHVVSQCATSSCQMTGC